MNNKGYFEYAKYGSIGISWVLTTSIYFYLGYKGGTYLDTWLGTGPLFLLVGLVGAMALSLRSLISEILTLISGPEEENETSSRASGSEKSNKSSQETEDVGRKGPR